MCGNINRVFPKTQRFDFNSESQQTETLKGTVALQTLIGFKIQ